MRERTLKTAAYTVTAFSVVSSAAQVLVLSLPYRLWTFGLTLVFAIVAFLLFRKARAYHNAVAALTGILRDVSGDRRFDVRRIVDEAELRELWAIDSDSYGDAAISYETFRAWWRRYPLGLYGLFEADDIIGGFGIWPLSRKTYKDFTEGRIKERELVIQRLGTARTGRQCWYISGIVLNARRRRTEAIRVLISNALRGWLQEVASTECLNVCALAYSSDGEALLRRFGFHRYKEANDTIDHYAVFARFDLSTVDLESSLQRLFPRPSWSSQAVIGIRRGWTNPARG